MNENERTIAMVRAQLLRLQREAKAIQSELERLREEEAESYLDGEVAHQESMRLGRPGPDMWGPTSGARSLFSRNKWGNSRIRKIGKLSRTKPPHKQW